MLRNKFLIVADNQTDSLNSDILTFTENVATKTA
jgi:hypothetical protein